MPSGATPHAVAIRLHSLADACSAFVDDVVDEALPAIGATLRTAALASAARDTGGDRRLSRYNGGRGATLDAAVTKAGRGRVTLTPRPAGPWALVEAGSRRAWWWEPRDPRRRRGSRLHLASGAVRWYVRHGGVRGHQTWSRAVERIESELPDVVHDSVVASWGRAMKGV